MKTLLCVGLAVGLGLAGCGKKPAPPPMTERAAVSGVSVASQAEASAPAPPAVEAPTESGAVSEPEQELSLKELTAAVQAYMQVSSDYPKDLSDLVKIKLLKKMPTAPPGKKYVIDRQNIRVILADK